MNNNSNLQDFITKANKNNELSKELSAGLYIVATPIGNLQDITFRAVATLAAADIILCEDTRVTQKLCTYYGVTSKLIRYDDHSTDRDRRKWAETIQRGSIVALVSDAGTPLVSDPGYKLVKEVVEAGLSVTSIPGACAAVNALALSALPSNQFTFLGFLPASGKDRRKLLEGVKSFAGSLIIYEGPSKVVATLETLLEVLGDRPAALAREMTKLYEEINRVSLSQLLEEYKNREQIKGEIVIIIGPSPHTEALDPAHIEAVIRALLETESVKDAAAEASATLGISKSEAYNIALRLKG
jgi:16S rRNA (cytidine1402-2'-O)-methyltransferase